VRVKIFKAVLIQVEVFNLKEEEGSTSEMLLTYQNITRRHNPDDPDFNTDVRANTTTHPILHSCSEI
jgi:hypothetical protein